MFCSTFIVSYEDAVAFNTKLSQILKAPINPPRKGNKLKALDSPKRERKPKHKVPYWANDWRKK